MRSSSLTACPVTSPACGFVVPRTSGCVVSEGECSLVYQVQETGREQEPEKGEIVIICWLCEERVEDEVEAANWGGHSDCMMWAEAFDGEILLESESEWRG